MEIMRSRAVSWPGAAWLKRPASVWLLLVSLPLTLSVGWLCGAGEATSALWLALGSTIMVATLIRPEIGIYVLALTVSCAPRAFELRPYSITSTELLVAWLSLCLLARLATRRQALIRTPLDKPMLVFVALVTFLTVTRDLYVRGPGALPDSTLQTGKNWVIYAFIYFLVVHSTANWRQIETTGSLLLTGAAIAALASYFVYLPHAQPERQLPFGITRLADIRFGGPNEFAIFTLIMTSMALSRLIRVPRGTSRVLLLLAVACMALPWRYTYSRTGFLLTGLTFMLLFYSWRKWLSPLAVAASVLIWYAIPAAYRYRVAEASPLRGTESFHYFAVSRAHLPDLTYVLLHPSARTLWGVGLYPGWEMQDNIYLFTLLSSGVLCLGGLAWLLVAVGRMLVRFHRSDDDPRGKALALGSLISLVLMGSAGMVINSFLIPLLATTFWVVIGLAASRFAMLDRARTNVPQNRLPYNRIA